MRLSVLWRCTSFVLVVALSSGCSGGKSGGDTIGATVASSSTTTTLPPTTTTSATTTSSTTTSTTATTTTTTMATVTDPGAALTEIVAAGDRWIINHEVTLDQVQSYGEVNLQVATEQGSVWAPIFDTDDGNVHALYAALAICTWTEEEIGPDRILEDIVTASSAYTDDPDELLTFAGLVVSGSANLFCPGLSDAVRQIVPQA